MNTPASLLSRRLVITLALFALVAAWTYMTHVAGNAPWYRHAEANLPRLTESLALNSGVYHARIGENGILSTYLLALDLHIRHRLDLLPTWNIPTLGVSVNPLQEIQTLVGIERMHGRILVLLLILCGGTLACAVVPGLESFCFTVALLCSGAGVLYHGLMIKPELLDCGLGLVLALLCLWHATKTRNWRHHHFGLFLAGLCGGFAALAQASGIFHLLVGVAWCWLAAFTSLALRPNRPGFRIGLLPVASAVILLWFAQEASVMGAITAVTAERLRALSLLAGLLPLLTLWLGAGRLGSFLRERASEFALLCGGALAALAIAYLALRAILPADAALICWSRQLDLLLYPGPFMENLLTAPTGIGLEVIRFVKESPFLYAAASALTLAVCLQRDVPARAKGLIILLLSAALGHTWQLAHLRYVESASVGVQVPLILVCAITVLAAGPWPHRHGRSPWLAPVILVAATVLLVTAPLRLRVNFPSFRTDDNPVVSAHTLTYLFDHHTHPVAFRQIMQKHYGNREGFERAVHAYLAQPIQHD